MADVANAAPGDVGTVSNYSSPFFPKNLIQIPVAFRLPSKDVCGNDLVGREHSFNRENRPSAEARYYASRAYI